jgi:hypothetical protein
MTAQLVLALVKLSTSLTLLNSTLAHGQEMTIPEEIKLYADSYGASYTQMMTTIKCESGFNTDIYGDHGAAYGLGQFHKATFYAFAKEMSIDADYYNYHDQIKVMAWAFANNKRGHWTCYRQLYT